MPKLRAEDWPPFFFRSRVTGWVRHSARRYRGLIRGTIIDDNNFSRCKALRKNTFEPLPDKIGTVVERNISRRLCNEPGSWNAHSMPRRELQTLRYHKMLITTSEVLYQGGSFAFGLSRTRLGVGYRRVSPSRFVGFMASTQSVGFCHEHSLKLNLLGFGSTSAVEPQLDARMEGLVAWIAWLACWGRSTVLSASSNLGLATLLLHRNQRDGGRMSLIMPHARSCKQSMPTPVSTPV